MATVEIVGGGIAGLTLACALRRPEWDVIVREQGRPAGTRDVDTAFGLWRPAMRALDGIGLGDLVQETGVRIDGATVRSADDRVLTRIRDQDVVMIGRTTLHRILHDALPGSVRWRSGRIEEAREVVADAIVGADGARSVVRRDHWGAGSAARAHGTTVVRGVVDHDLSRGELTEYWGDGVLYGVTPLPGGRTNWFTAFPERRFGGVDEAIAHVRGVARAFPPQVSAVLEEATPEQTLVNGVHVSRSLASFVRGRAVLLGDAAHAMTPNLGRGACEAIRDAVALGALLNAHEPAQALSRYRRRRLIAPQLFRTAASLVSRVALAAGERARRRDRVISMVPGPR
jgi:2-polyprenyl-6-methoxyphenol hydroxylase-like FAD-dependent oxidoreductase